MQGSKSFVEVLFLIRKYLAPSIADAIRKALSHESVSIGIVRFYLRDADDQAAPAVATIDYPGPDVRQASIDNYSALLGTLEVKDA